MKKKKIWLLISCIVLFVLASLSVVFLALNGKIKDTGGKVAKTEENTEVLLSFDSYEEITKAGLKIGNQFGETKINTEKTYITEGKGSWLVRPQGDYGKEGYYPYFRLRCTESTFMKSDFNAYDKLLLDIYNDSDEEIEIEFMLSVTNPFDSYDTGETVIWTLEPNAWTKCEYDLTGEEYSSALNITEARYMNFSILSKKESKDDKIPTLYFDNLRGHLWGEEREIKEFTCNLREVVTFENILERYLFNAGTVGQNKVTLSRVAYENSIIGAQGEEYGTYGLQGIVQGSTWPATTIRYNEELPAGTIISCKVYVAADEKEFGDATYFFEAPGCTMRNGRLKFNRWEMVEFELQKDVDSTWFFLNFDNGEGTSMFGKTPVTYFMDNFQIVNKPEVDFTKGVNIDDPLERLWFKGMYLAEYEDSTIGKQSDTYGKYGLMRDVTKSVWPSFTIDLDKQYSEGDVLTFMLYVDVDEKLAAGQDYHVGAYGGHGVTNDTKDYNKWVEVQIPLKKATDSVGVFLNFDDGNEKNMFGEAPMVAYVDNFKVIDIDQVEKRNNFLEGITFEDRGKLQEYLISGTELVTYADTSLGKQANTHGTYGVMKDVTKSTWPGFNVNLCKKYEEGDVLTFMLYVEADAKLAAGQDYHVGVYGGHGVNNDTKDFNKWVEVQIPLKKATDEVGIFLNFDNGNEKPMFGEAKVTAYMDNFKIIDISEVEKKNDFSEKITFEDRAKLQEYLFDGTGLVTYANTSLGKQDSTYGTYGIQKDATGSTWPAFYANLCKEYNEGDVLKFDLYVEVDQKLANGKDYHVGVYGGHNVVNDRKEFNQWVTVQIPIKKATDNIGIFLNFDDGNQKNMFGKAKLTAYMDNFEVIDTTSATKLNDFSEGIDFEDRAKLSEYLFSNTELVTYANTSLGKQDDTYGAYGIMRDATGSTWPAFYANLCKEYKEGDMLSFMLYVEADEKLAEGKNYFVGVYGGHSVINDRKEFNQWVEVQIPIKKATDNIGMFLNFDNGNSKPMFGDAEVIAYMDNFKIIDTSQATKLNDFKEMITFEDREKLQEFLITNSSLVTYEKTTLGKQSDTYGNYGIMRDGTKSTWPNFYVDFCEEYSAGDILTFMLYVEADENLTSGKHFYVSAYDGHDVSNDKKVFNKWVQVNVPLKKATSKIGLFLNFDDGTGKSMFGNAKVHAYMDNFQIIKTEQISKSTDFENGVTFEGEGIAAQYLFSNADFVKYADTTLGQQSAEFGENGLTFDATNSKWPGFTVLDLGKTYPAGSRLCFKIYAKADENLAKDLYFWVDNDDGTKHPFNQWTEGFVKVTGDTRYIFLNFETALKTLGTEEITVYLDNFYITEGDFEKGITLENRAEKYMFSKNNVNYSLEEFDGDMAMKFDSTGIKFPYVKVNFNKKYTGNAARLCFKIYVKVDESLVKDQVFYVGNDDGTKHPFNQWTEGWVKVTNANYKQIFLNLDKAISATIKNAPITVYLDDFYVTEGKAENKLTFENPAEKYAFWKGNVTYSFEGFDGDMAMKYVVNQNWPSFYMQLNSSYSTKKTLYFKVYAKVDEELVTDEKYYVGNNDPVAHSFNKWEEGFVTIDANKNSMNVFLNFEKALKTIGKDNITVYLDDFVIK